MWTFFLVLYFKENNDTSIQLLEYNLKLTKKEGLLFLWGETIVKSLPMATASSHLLFLLSVVFFVDDVFCHPCISFSLFSSSSDGDTGFSLPGTAFLLWYLLCPHMSWMYHGATCGSQLYLPPRCPPGLQNSYHPAPGRCSARTTGYSGKILPAQVLNFFFLSLTACLVQGRVSGKKLSDASVSFLTPSVLPDLTEVAVWLKTKCCYEFCIPAA